MTGNSRVKGSVRVQCLRARRMPVVPPLCNSLKYHNSIMMVCGGHNIWPPTPQKVPANTSALCLNTMENTIKKVIITHCTETWSSVCKQVYRAAFAYMSLFYCIIQMCAVDNCIRIKSRWLASASCHVMFEKKRFYRKQNAPFREVGVRFYGYYPS